MLACICSKLTANGFPAVVIKSLDHWPDLGSDFDIYTTGSVGEIRKLCCQHSQRDRRNSGLLVSLLQRTKRNHSMGPAVLVHYAEHLDSLRDSSTDRAVSCCGVRRTTRYREHGAQFFPLLLAMNWVSQISRAGIPHASRSVAP